MNNQRAHHLLSSAQYCGKAILRGYRLFSLGEFPRIQPCEGEHVIGELYYVDDSMICQLDSYEGEGILYKREEVTVIRRAEEKRTNSLFYFGMIERAYAYVYLGKTEDKETIRCEWNMSDDDYVWYAAYGSNIDEDRFICYLEGGICAANGRLYHGCDDKSRWIDEQIALLPGDVYAANCSSSWKGKGVAFYDENGRNTYIKGFVFMKLYKIRRNQLLQIQKQEGMGPGWYERLVPVLIFIDDIPIYTFTSKNRGEFNEPDFSYVHLIEEAISRECVKYGMQYDFSKDVFHTLCHRPQRYEELTVNEQGYVHPYKLYCCNCMNDESECRCYENDMNRFKTYVPIDNDMIEAIKLFNRKGYGTYACCQGDIERIGDKFIYGSYIGFNDPIPEGLELIGMDKKYVRYKHWNKQQTSAIYIHCELKIGKTNLESQKEKIERLRDEAINAWMLTAEAWPKYETVSQQKTP